MKVTDVLIIGASNPTIISTIEDINDSKSGQRFNILGLLDNNISEQHLLGYPVLGGFDECNRFSKDVHLVNTIASSCQVRYESTQFFLNMGWTFSNIIHPSIDCRYVQMEQGNIIYEKAMIQPRVRLGSFNVISSLSGIAHDTCLKNNNFIGPNSYICGRVTIGSNCFLIIVYNIFIAISHLLLS